MVTIIAPAMGIAVRFTRSKEETPPIPEDTTITAVIGEQLRMICLLYTSDAADD